MAAAKAGKRVPGRLRIFIAAAAVILTVVAVWKVIDYRTQPPPPPHPLGERVGR